MIDLQLDRNVLLDVYRALDSETRLDILISLGEQNSLTFSDLTKGLQLSDGKLHYHLDILFEAKLIHNEYKRVRGRSDYSHYSLTERGSEILRGAGVLE